MSLYQLFRTASSRLTRLRWGTRITDSDGQEKDTGVNELAEELAGMLSSRAPFELDAPLRIVKNYTGPTFDVVTQPTVEAGDDALSSETEDGEPLTLPEVYQTAKDAQEAADEAAELAANPAQIIFPGVITAAGVFEDGVNITYFVDIVVDGETTNVEATYLGHRKPSPGAAIIGNTCAVFAVDSIYYLIGEVWPD